MEIGDWELEMLEKMEKIEKMGEATGGWEGGDVMTGWYYRVVLLIVG